MIKKKGLKRTKYYTEKMVNNPAYESEKNITARIAHYSNRHLFKDATANALRQILGKHITQEDKIIEIGSGLGWLVELLPEYKSRIQQTDADSQVVKQHLFLRPDSNIKQVNAFELPYPFSKYSFDAAIGLDSLDELGSELAYVSIGTTIVRDGKLFHFRDLLPSPQSISGFSYDKEVITFPAFDKEGYKIGVRLVRRNDAVKNMHRLSPNAKIIAGRYLDNSEYWYGVYKVSNDFLIHLSDIGEKLSQHAKEPAHVIRFHEYYFNNLESKLKKTGYVIIDSGNTNGTAFSEKVPEMKMGPKDNLYRDDVGFVRRSFDPKIAEELRPNEVKLISTLQYLVAQKDNSFYDSLEAGEKNIVSLLERKQISHDDAAKMLEALVLRLIKESKK